MNRHGIIADDKTRMTIILPIDVRDALRAEAEACGRTMSNYVAYILAQHVQQQQKG